MDGIVGSGTAEGAARPGDRLATAQAMQAGGEIRAAADEALRVAEAGRRSGDVGLVAGAALLSVGVPDATTAPVVESICRMALEILPPDAVAQRARVHGRLSVALHHRERLGEAMDHAERAEQLAADLDDPFASAAALHARQMSMLGSGDPRAILEVGARLLDLANRAASADIELIGRNARIDAFFRLGDTAAARHEIDSLDVLASRTGGRLERWNALLAQAGLDHATGRLTEAERLSRAARSALPESQRHQSEPLFIAQLMLIATDLGTEPAEIALARRAAIGAPLIAVAMTGRYDLEVGDLTRARASFASAWPRLADLAMDRRGLPTLTALLDLAVALADEDAIRGLRGELLPYAGRMLASAVGAVGPVAWFLARADGAIGRADDAIVHAETAVEISARGDFGPWLARSRLEAAEALARRGRPGDRRAARSSAELAASAAVQLGMAGLAARSGAALRRLSAIDRLSRRELEVARLVAGGASNREIASDLVLSERTIETHVQNILVKLDVHSRTQIATWVLRNGIAGRPPDA